MVGGSSYYSECMCVKQPLLIAVNTLLHYRVPPLLAYCYNCMKKVLLRCAERRFKIDTFRRAYVGSSSKPLWHYCLIHIMPQCTVYLFENCANLYYRKACLLKRKKRPFLGIHNAAEEAAVQQKVQHYTSRAKKAEKSYKQTRHWTFKKSFEKEYKKYVVFKGMCISSGKKQPGAATACACPHNIAATAATVAAACRTTFAIQDTTSRTTILVSVNFRQIFFNS